jgi:hypothetical protein
VGKETTEERSVPTEDDLSMLREEAETLAEFLRLLQREYAQLQADLASVLAVIGNHIEVPPSARQADPLSRHIERTEDPATGTITFRLMHDE